MILIKSKVNKINRNTKNFTDTSTFLHTCYILYNIFFVLFKINHKKKAYRKHLLLSFELVYHIICNLKKKKTRNNIVIGQGRPLSTLHHFGQCSYSLVVVITRQKLHIIFRSSWNPAYQRTAKTSYDAIKIQQI